MVACACDVALVEAVYVDSHGSLDPPAWLTLDHSSGAELCVC